MKQKGFTIIELLISVTIVIILTMLIVPTLVERLEETSKEKESTSTKQTYKENQTYEEDQAYGNTEKPIPVDTETINRMLNYVVGGTIVAVAIVTLIAISTMVIKRRFMKQYNARHPIKHYYYNNHLYTEEEPPYSSVIDEESHYSSVIDKKPKKKLAHQKSNLWSTLGDYFLDFFREKPGKTDIKP